MSDDEINRLLDVAKQNLSKSVSESDDNDTIESISASWKTLPQIEDDLTDNTSRRKKSNGVTKLTQSDEKEKNSRGIRRVVDPVKVKADKKLEEESHAGNKWFNMPKTEVTPSIKRDLQMLQMRNVLDPKRHYKKDKSGPPKYFQTGTIVEGNTEFFSARLSKKDRKQTLADEILSDQASQQYFKRKYNEIQAASTSGRKTHYKKVKKMRKKY